MYKVRYKILKKISQLLFPYLEEIEKENRYDFYKNLASTGDPFNLKKDPFIIGENHIYIGDGFKAGYHFRMEAIDHYKNQIFHPKIKIGTNVSFEDFCHIACIDDVSIGDNVLIASKVFITDHFHGQINSTDLLIIPKDRELISKPVSIGCNCWIGEGVSIMPGVTIGDNVTVGANSVVTHSFPSNSVIAGNPAKLLKSI